MVFVQPYDLSMENPKKINPTTFNDDFNQTRNTIKGLREVSFTTFTPVLPLKPVIVSHM